MSDRPGVNFKPGGPCIRDCRVHPFDTDSPYVPPLCSGCERSVHACVCSCIDMYPDWSSIVGVGDGISSNGLVAAVAQLTGVADCYCDNSVDYKAAVSSVVATYNFGWDETSLNPLNRILAKAQELCPDDPHTRVRIYAAVPTTNLACVQSSADWGDPPGTAILDQAVFGDDPEPSFFTTWDAPRIVKTGHEPIFDCEATKEAQPLAFLIEWTTSCGPLLLLCPNLNPGGVIWTCPDCTEDCISITVAAGGDDTFSSPCADGTSTCTVGFTIFCPGLCACLTGHVNVTFTLDGTPVTMGPFAAACGATLSVTSDALACGEGSGPWSVHIEWVCDSSDTPCSPATGCRETSCTNSAEKNITVALGGGIVP